jgi:hypothetical protein
MAKKPLNNGKAWKQEDNVQLKKLAKGDTPTPLIAYKLKRTTEAIYAKAEELNISLKPVNKSPYNRHTKQK